MRVIGNILWLLLGGLWLALGYAVAGLAAFFLIITIPFGIQAFKLAGFTLWPFGSVMVPRPGASAGLSAIGNVIWLFLAGIWLALGHLVAALVNAITIIGIPFAVAHLKLAGAALMPFGLTVVSAEEARRRGVAAAVTVEPLGE
ncbi:MAG: YccF domain-containing protein [Acidimicrobiia bacterium]|nr:YccF domain-containing protein [Acidimicrobiia bacterium]